MDVRSVGNTSPVDRHSYKSNWLILAAREDFTFQVSRMSEIKLSNVSIFEGQVKFGSAYRDVQKAKT